MCQSDIINYLKKKKRPVDMRELLVNIPANRSSISKSCSKLRKNHEVKFRKEKVGAYEKFIYSL